MRGRSGRASRKSWGRDAATGWAGERAPQTADAAIEVPVGGMGCTRGRKAPSLAAGWELDWEGRVGLLWGPLVPE